MNEELSNIISIYATEGHKELNECLLGKSKELLMATLIDLITMYINDKNSSSLREFITVNIAGYKHSEAKLGYNGFRQSSFDSHKIINCEAKPKNINTNNKIVTKLNGGGNFSDYTFGRLKRDSEKEGLNMLVSGFVDGRLIYILEFPFNSPKFISRLKEVLLRRFSGGKDISGQYLRSAEFNYRHYIGVNGLKIVYSIDKNELARMGKYIVKDFLIFLLKNV